MGSVFGAFEMSGGNTLPKLCFGSMDKEMQNNILPSFLSVGNTL